MRTVDFRLCLSRLEEDRDRLNRLLRSLRVISLKAEGNVCAEGPCLDLKILLADDRRRKPEGFATRQIRIFPERRTRKTLPSEVERRELSQEDFQLLERLKEWRRQESALRRVKEERLVSEELLLALVRLRPKTIGELGMIKGFGGYKLRRNGAALLKMLAETGRES